VRALSDGGERNDALARSLEVLWVGLKGVFELHRCAT
jgi:hypothetical protein